MTSFKLLILATATLFLNGCVTDSTSGSGLVEGTSHSAITRKISGKVFCMNGRQQIPTGRATVSVTKDKAIMFSTSTSADGSYMLPSSFESDGTYGLAALAACGKEARKLPKTVKDEIKNENFYLKR